MIDSINGVPYSEKLGAPTTLAALSLVRISGHISSACDGSDLDTSFNGSTNLTLYDAPSTVSVTSTFTAQAPITDTWQIDGPILYSGGTEVTDGKFTTEFVVSKDIKFDTNHAKISMLAYSNDLRSALGAAQHVIVYGIDTSRVASDHTGPALTVYIGSRAFHSGDRVPINSEVIVDVADASGLNTSTSGIGHSFAAWVDDSTDALLDLSQNYVAVPNDFTKGTSTVQTSLPVGTHTLNVRAFDAAGNPSFASVEFTAVGQTPYRMINVTVYPNPMSTAATFTFEQPAPPESPLDATLDIYNTIGQHVRTILAPSISANVVTIPFDGNNDAGSRLSDGVYLYRIAIKQRLSGASAVSGGTFVITHDH